MDNTETKKDSLKKISKYLKKSFSFICTTSFEERCLSIAKNLSVDAMNNSYIMCGTTKEAEDLRIKHLEDLRRILDNKSKEISFSMRNSVSIVEAVVKIVRDLVNNREKNILVDISTFTHEMLLILMKAFYEKKGCFDSIFFVYNGARQYSVGDSPDAIWLSKGCKDIRNVYGYPGSPRITQKNHLIVLSGFEIERATKMIEEISPDYLTLGNGCEPTEDEHNEAMNYFKGKLEEWRKTFSAVQTDSFDFSCRDVYKTANCIREIIKKSGDRNYILVPLNTKLSTISVGLVALTNPSIQVHYSIPALYNYYAYSEPSNNFSMVDMLGLMEN